LSARWLMVAGLLATFPGCFPGPVGDEPGAPCNAHGQCASGLFCDDDVCRSGRPRECEEGVQADCVLPNKHGICGEGTQTCIDGAWGTCRAPAPTTERCDGLDNNCNGEVDEMDVLFQVAAGAVYLDNSGHPLEVGAPCLGQGACRLGPDGEALPGVVVCVADPAEHPAGLHTCCDADPHCPAADSPGRSAEESCNGEDDDCDGQTDEDCPA